MADEKIVDFGTDRLLSRSEALQRLGIDGNKFSKIWKDGTMPTFEVNGSLRITKFAFNRFMADLQSGKIVI